MRSFTRPGNTDAFPSAFVATSSNIWERSQPGHARAFGESSAKWPRPPEARSIAGNIGLPHRYPRFFHRHEKSPPRRTKSDFSSWGCPLTRNSLNLRKHAQQTMGCVPIFVFVNGVPI